MANLVVLLVLCLPFVSGSAYAMDNDDFWSAVAFLAALQASALVLNLLPIPGLDGFGILSPYLPEEVQEQANAFTPMLGPLLVTVFLNKSVGLAIWNAVSALTTRLDIAPSYIFAGLSLFRFWTE
jgi:Zn-dependent protease